jgi:hypothetical protein
VKTCSSCVYFAALQAQCRKNPPTAIAAANGNQLQIIGIWPPTKDSDWCGAHESDRSMSLASSVASRQA